jgi:hypothetical protein
MLTSRTTLPSRHDLARRRRRDPHGVRRVDLGHPDRVGQCGGLTADDLGRNLEEPVGAAAAIGGGAVDQQFLPAGFRIAQHQQEPSCAIRAHAPSLDLERDVAEWRPIEEEHLARERRDARWSFKVGQLAPG